MQYPRSPKILAKLIDYILGRKPDEFGLVPDTDGFVKIKDLLKALHEEDGWQYVRRHHLEEICLTLSPAPIEIRDPLIRARQRKFAVSNDPAHDLPKLLFTCVRRRTHPVVMEKGILPLGHPHVISTDSRETALKIGRRLDPLPVLLTIQVHKALASGVEFTRAGDGIYLSDAVPAGCFSGPPLPKAKPDTDMKPRLRALAEERLRGSFTLAMPEEGQPKKGAHQRRREETLRQKERKRSRVEKQKRWTG